MAQIIAATTLELHDVNNAALFYSEQLLLTLLSRGLIDRQEYSAIYLRIAEHYGID